MNRQEYNKIYREKNKDVLRAYDKAYYDKNRELKQRQKREYHHLIKNNPEYKERRKKYYEEKKEAITKKNNEYKKEHRKHYTELSRLSRERKFERLAGRPRPEICEVCGSAEKIVYDHNHKTGEFRGWICFSCNTALGHARDNPEVLQKLIDYLNKSNKPILLTKKQIEELNI